MAQQDEIVLKIGLDTGQIAEKIGVAQDSLNMLKARQKELEKQLADGTISWESYGKQIAAVKSEIEKESRAVKSNTALLQMETAATLDASASLDEQRQALNAAQKAYAQLSGEEKKAADAKGGLRDQIKALSDRVKAQEQAMGDARRNVGNYTESIIEASKQMGGLGGGMTSLLMPIKNVTLGLKAMSATPVIAILSALITILTKLAERFKNNAAAMESLTKVFGVFSGAANIVNVIIDKIAEGIGWLAEKALELAEKLGLISDAMKEGQAIAEEDIAIQKKQQEVALENAKSQKKIAELRSDAAEKDKHTAQERLNLLQQAADEEEKIAQRQYDLAKREYDLQVRKNAQSNSSIEDLKKENDLQIAMINAETALFNKKKELATQMATLREQIAKGNEAALDADINAANKEAEALEKLRNEMVRRARTQLENDIADLEAKRDAEIQTAGLTADELLAIEDYYAEEIKKRQDAAAQGVLEEETRKIEARMAAREQFGLDPTKSMEQQELEALEAARAADLLNDEEYQQAKTIMEEKYSKKRKQTMDEEIRKNTIETAQAYASGASAITSLLGTLSNAFQKLGDESEDSKKAARAFAWVALLTSQAQAVANTVSAVTKAIESATNAAAQTGIAAPITTPIFIAEMVGIVAGAAASAISGIVEAKSLIDQAKGYETGGVVGGTSYTGDKILARVNSGETILPLDKAEKLFDALSGPDGSIGNNFDTMLSAYAAMPAPVLVYTELEEYGQNIATINEIAEV